MPEHITLIIADDHPVFRAGLTAIVASYPEFELLAEATNGEELLTMVERYHPDVVLTDIDMPKLNGIEVLKSLQNKPSKPKIVFLTLYDDEEFFNAAMDFGVNGFLLKENAAAEIVAAVRTVAEGKYYLAAGISDFMVRRSERKTSFEKEYPGLRDLTAAELNILRLVAQGSTTKEIAGKLFIGIKTVESHRTNISKKLRLTGTHALVKFAIEHKNRL